jgi:hypothetical protein
MDRAAMTRVAIMPIGLFMLSAASTTACGGPSGRMNFFVTSVPPGDGGNLGGLRGADAHCQKLAHSVGSRKREWRAYLSAAATNEQAIVNARDRIEGPWFNSQGNANELVIVELENGHR